MISDFVSEDMSCSARQQLEYGENAEGYWTNEKFMKQMELAIKIPELRYPKSDGYRHFWVFDHSSCHAAKSEDSLDVSRMNVMPGGKQPKMREWNGELQKMFFNIGIPKGMKQVLEE